MKRLALPVAVVAAAVAVPLAIGSSHREAPGISLDPAADNTDVYAFTADDAPGSLTVVANWIPQEDPAGGPNFYRFDDRARYYVKIDNTGDGREDVAYRFAFKTRVVNRESFLYAAPGVTSIRDPKLNVQQSYTVVRESYRRGELRSERVIARGVPVAPNNVGPRTFPDYDAVASQAVRRLRGGGTVFAGQVDDPFFVDLGATFDGVSFRNGTGNAGGGKDDLAGLNTHAVVLQVPERQVTRNGRSVSGPDASNAVVGVWSTTERLAPRVRRLRGRGEGDRYVQVSRLANPLVNEVVIPLGKKDQFNRTTPDRDARLYGKYVLEPELARLMNALYDLNVPERNRTDIVQALLTGIPDLTQIGRNPAAADTLKLNLGVPPSATQNRFGVIAGDTAGFPNGRRLADDTTDIELRVIGGFLLSPEQGGQKLPLGDGVDQNDVPFRTAFPYVAPPHAGLDSDPKRTEPTHEPTPGQP